MLPQQLGKVNVFALVFYTKRLLLLFSTCIVSFLWFGWLVSLCAPVMLYQSIMEQKFHRTG